MQPCRRPADGRYGENPNRLQHYYQFQVVLKPSPDHIQQLYLDSLKELGIDTAVHDIRFVEDNWESPTLGAWGLGWEVWLNGMEVPVHLFPAGRRPGMLPGHRRDHLRPRAHRDVPAGCRFDFRPGVDGRSDSR